MKMKNIVAMTMAATMVWNGTAVFGAIGVKTAVLNDARISFNGGTLQTIQCYMIEGYNYIRARDVTNNLNMHVTQMQDENTGIVVQPNMATSSVRPTEKLTKQSAAVNVQKGWLVYDATPFEAECFLLDNRFYFKLSDFQKASDLSRDISLVWVAAEAADQGIKEPYPNTYYGMEVSWDAENRVVHVDRVNTDLKKVFDDIRSNQSQENEEMQKPEEPKKESQNSKNPESQEAVAKDSVEAVFQLVNQERKANGRRELVLDPMLCEAAQVRASELDTLFSHTRPSGESCFSILDEYGLRYSGAGENIAKGQRDADEVMDSWMNSEGHRNNILSSDFTKIGIGHTGDNWVQLFMK